MADRMVSPRCEYLTRWHFNRPTFCEKPTAYWYPVGAGRTMALCEEHAQPHVKHPQALGSTIFKAPVISGGAVDG